MRQGSRWIISNAGRFTAVWLASLTVGALAIPGETPFPAPHSVSGFLSFPLALLLTVLLAAMTACIAFVFFSPVLALWLAGYLVVIFGLGRALPTSRSSRMAGFVAAPLLWAVFVHSGDR